MKIYLLISTLSFLFVIWLIGRLHRNEIKKIILEGGIKFEGVFIKVNRFTESLKIAGITALISIAVLVPFLFPLGLVIMILLILSVFFLSFLINYFMDVPWGLSFNYDYTLGGAPEIAKLKLYLLMSRNGLNGVFRCPYKNILSVKRAGELIFQIKFRKWPYFLYRLFRTDRVILQFKSKEDGNIFEKNIKEFTQKFI